ncbi:LacI family DNA-binding transcriptional regulator [Kineococcus gynurae]|uniref:LacI family DNA-binding transcriptional regulator n=1 Tax=Kineococcus gynurae TaxID=452979 RepID=A0ABV5LXC3_9ACTN
MTRSTDPVPRATMRDVAAQAGVSLKTVSRVVNEEPGVREVVVDRVRSVAAELGYRHHRGASDLRRRGQRTGAIGVLVQDVANDYSARLLRALEDATRARGLILLAASIDEDPDRERHLVGQMLARRVDALVLMATTPRQDYLLPDIRAGLGVVCVDRAPVGVEVDAVTIDNVGGSRAAVERLLDQGHRRVAFLGDLPNLATAHDRFAGFREALANRGAVPDPALVRHGLRTAEEARRAVEEMLTRSAPPTAIFAARNVLTTGCLLALHHDVGRSTPPAIAGFDDMAHLDLVGRPLLIVRQDVEEIGRTAARLLEERLLSPTRRARSVVLAPELVSYGDPGARRRAPATRPGRAGAAANR